MPARASADAVELLRIMEILPDLMIVCPRVPGSSELVQHFRRKSPLMKVIVAVDALEDAGQFTAAADICRVKPNHYDDLSGLEWVDLADRILHSRDERCPTPCLT